jgi:hypothetical protein
MRNTVIFYKDWYEAVKDFSPDERLKAYDAIMQYAFEGVVPEDKFIRAATALMRTAIDRDNNKYDEVCERNRRNVMNRWRKRFGNDTTEYDRKQPNTVATYNDNDNYNGNDNDNDNDNKPTTKVAGNNKDKEKKDIEKKKVAKAPVRFKKPTVEEVSAYCNDRGNYINAQNFVDFYESKGWKVGSSPMKDWKAAVRTWEQRDGRPRRKNNQQANNLGVGEYIDDTGRRTYGTGRATIPMSAPPRPSERYSWDEQSQNWVML